MSTNLAPSLEDFQLIRLAAAATFDLDARLPEMVFRRPASASLFCEYEALFAADFWPALAAVATAHDDQVIDLIVLEPSAATYYVPEYAMYPAFSISVKSNEDCYWDALNEEPGGDISGAIIHSADVVALTGPSSGWGIWGDRGLGVAVVEGVSTVGGAGGWREKYGPFLGVEGALAHYVAPNFGGQVPSDLAEALVRRFTDRREW